MAKVWTYGKTTKQDYLKSTERFEKAEKERSNEFKKSFTEKVNAYGNVFNVKQTGKALKGFKIKW